jgi:putative hydrolase of the HAD superfamily
LNTLPPHAIIFDLDDTLIQTHNASNSTWRELENTFAIELRVDETRFREAIGDARRLLWADPVLHREWRHRMGEAPAEILRMAAESLDIALPENMGERFNNRYVRQFFRGLHAFPQAHEVVGDLRTRGVKLGMITNGGAGWQRRKLVESQFIELFDVIFIEGEFGVGKPDRAIFDAAISALGTNPERAWMIGDRLDWDVAGAQAAGIKGVWFDFLHKGLPDDAPTTPDFIARTLDDLLQLYLQAG